MRYVIYTRVSKKKQTTENQLKECREYVYKLTLKGDEVHEFEEPDSSTQKPMHLRKKLQELLAFLRKGDRLVVYKVDRLARDKQELINLYSDIKKKGIDIVGLNDPSLNDESICIYAFMACSERKNIQTRTKTALKLKMSKNERVGAVTYGYKLDASKLQLHREEVHSYNKPYILLPDEEESKQIALMQTLYSEGHSYTSVAREMKVMGFRNRAGNPVHKMTVSRVLKRLESSPMAESHA